MIKKTLMQIDTSEFLSNTAIVSLDLEERGALITLMIHCFKQGWLPSDSTTLARLCGNPSNWEEISAVILPLFIENEGKLFHPDIDKQLKTIEEWREKSRLGGRRSAATRKRVNNGKNGGVKVGSTTLKKAKNSQQSIIIYNKNCNEKNIYKDKYSQITNDQFEELWKFYPGTSEQKGSKLKARKKILAKGYRHSFEQTKKAFNNYGQNSKTVADGFIKHMITFLNSGFVDQWLDASEMLGIEPKLNESCRENIRRLAL